VRLAVVLTSDNVAIWAPGFDPGQWKLLTHWLVAPGLLAAVIDVLCVYFAGRMVEELFGTRRFTLLFIAACVLAGLLAGLVDPLLMGESRVSVIMAWVSRPMNSGPVVPCARRKAQMAAVVATMCPSLKAVSNDEPRCPDVPKATRCPGTSASGCAA
jgi:hypothetical protein